MIVGFMLVLFAVLTGCTNVVTVIDPVSGQLYTVEDFDYASRNGEIRARVGGNPFGGSHAAFSDKVTNLMYGANFGGDVAFVPPPGGTGSGRHHVVMVFNPPISADETDFCVPNAKVATGPLSDTLRLVAAFCYEDTLLSTSTGHVRGVRHADASLFRALVRQVTLSLFPGHDDLDMGDDAVRSSN